MNRPTIKAVTKRANVSLKTVSRVIQPCDSTVPGLADELRDLVQRVRLAGLVPEPPMSERMDLIRYLADNVIKLVRILWAAENPDDDHPCVDVDDRDAAYDITPQSGKSPDLVDQADAAKRAGARVVAMVNVEGSPLAHTADFVIPLRAGAEFGVAATKTFFCSLSALLHLAAEWSDDFGLRSAVDHVPAAQDASWPLDWSPLVDELAGARNHFLVGRGLGLAAARDVALKLKETCGLHAEAFSSAEVQHGPMAFVGENFPVLFFVQDDDTREGTLDVAGKFRERGARAWVAGQASGPGMLPLATRLDPACAPLISVHPCYGAINALAVRRRRDPDAPPHLREVNETI